MSGLSESLPMCGRAAARLHVQIENLDSKPQWKVTLRVASDPNGTSIPAATATLASEGAKP